MITANCDSVPQDYNNNDNEDIINTSNDNNNNTNTNTGFGVILLDNDGKWWLW